MSRCIVNVSTGQFVRGADRLRTAAERHSRATSFRFWRTMPPGCPPHSIAPFAFKAHALCEASRDHQALIWADASILPIRDMEPLWEKIETDGYYVCNNGWLNAQWTADSAYADLEVSREDNWTIKHCVAGFFGLDLRHEVGRSILNEYIHLSRTNAFKGPVWNRNNPQHGTKPGAAPCGPPEVMGHRHDQTALSVIAWRMGCLLTDPPQFFCYRGGETEDTVAVADGGY